MNALTLSAVFFIVWWIVLFAVLPWGVRTHDEDKDVILGTAPSAPVRPMLVRKALATTVVAAIVVALIWYGVEILGFDLDWAAERFRVRPASGQ